MKCSEYHAFGGTLEPKDSVRLMQTTYERLLIHDIRKGEYDLYFWLNRYALGAIDQFNLKDSYLKQQLDELHRETLFSVHSIFKTFPPRYYATLSGPWDHPIRVSKSRLNLHLSGILRCIKDQSVHVVTFSPFELETDVLNDPITHLKVQSLRSLMAAQPIGQAKISLHTFYISNKGFLRNKTLDSTDVNKRYLQGILKQAKTIEYGLHYPLVPCPYSCTYKHICGPLRRKDEGVRN